MFRHTITHNRVLLFKISGNVYILSFNIPFIASSLVPSQIVILVNNSAPCILNYTSIKEFLHFRNCDFLQIITPLIKIFNGAGDRDRTCDLPLTRRLLFQLSYASMKAEDFICLNNHEIHKMDNDKGW